MVDIPSVNETLARIERLSEIANDVGTTAADLRVACEVYPRAGALATSRDCYAEAGAAIWDAVELLEATITQGELT